MKEEKEVEETDANYYGPGEMAKLFRVDAKTIARWDKAGKFKQYGIMVVRTFGGHRRFSKERTDQVIKELSNRPSEDE